MRVWCKLVVDLAWCCVLMTFEHEWVEGVSICRRELWPWWETNNEAVVVRTFNTHTLVLKRKCNVHPSWRLFTVFKVSASFILSLRSSPAVLWLSLCPCFLKRWRDVLYFSWWKIEKLRCRCSVAPTSFTGGIPLINQVNYHWSLIISPHHRVICVWFTWNFARVTLSWLTRTYGGVKVFDFLVPKLGKHKLSQEHSESLSLSLSLLALLWVRGLRTFDLLQTSKADSWFPPSQSELRLWSCPPACLHTLFFFVWRHMLLFWPRFCPRDYLGLSKSLVFELQSHFWLLPLTSDSPLQPQTFL